MSTGGKKRPRSPRVAPLDLPPGSMERLWQNVRRGDVLARLGVALGALVLMWVIVGGWSPRFSFREGYVPPRDITAELAFRQPNATALQEAQKRAFEQAPSIYRQDAKQLELLRANLQNIVSAIAAANTLEELKADTWKQFQLPQGEKPALPGTEQEEEDFARLHTELTAEHALKRLEQAVAEAFAPFERNGLLEKLPEAHGKGNQKEIKVYPLGRNNELSLVQVSDVLIGDAEPLHKRLKEGLPEPLAERIFAWLRPRLPNTLVIDQEATQQARLAASAQVPPASTDRLIQPGEVLAPRNKPLDANVLALLRLEHQQYLADLPLDARIERAVAMFFFLAALFGLCGYYTFGRDRLILTEWWRLGTLLLMSTATVAVVPWTVIELSRIELIPLLLFGMTLAIAWQRDVALVLTWSLAVTISVASGFQLGSFLILAAVTASAITQLDRIRSRGKLIKVGAISAAVAFFVTIAISLIQGQPLILSEGPMISPLVWSAVQNAMWTFLAGFLLTGLLPMIENYFGVLTEISLLEWGDVSHPLLQELVRRAPGTYNHSINVASLAEAAAESVGAHGLLVRVGAYFHDIGKLLKPDYFTENQSSGSNRHDTLNPAMSTLIIIAHVKDGADLAQQHDLPEPIIDFIEQHHGTTLVEYFFNRASEQSEADPHAAEVHENAFRYPGPKPQTIEAAVLMIADAVESASRSLVEPTPGRLEGLVEDIAMKRLLDGQFDECGLTLEQLRTIRASLVKSLTAVYHGRIKYPSQQIA